MSEPTKTTVYLDADDYRRLKALARALRVATEIDPRKADAIPSTKGTLGSA